MMAKKNILIITPYSDFGGIINQSLSADPSLNVQVASTKHEIQACLRSKTAFGFALLDLDLGESKVLELGFSLRGNLPGIEIVLISKKEPAMGLDELRPWKLLRKPFVQSDLDGILHSGIQPAPEPSEVIDLNFNEWQDIAPHAWWDDESRVTRTLLSAISELDVQEAILFSSEDILAQAGKLDGAAVEECSRLVGNIKLEQDTSEILKPVHLKTTKSNHFIHATILAVGILLALMYDAETPLKDIRVQSRRLTQILKNPQLSDPEGKPLPASPKLQPEGKTAELNPVPSAAGTITGAISRSHHPRLIQYYNRCRKQSRQVDLQENTNPSVALEDPGRVLGKEDIRSTGKIEIHLPRETERQVNSDWLQDTLHWTSPSAKTPGQERHFSLCSPELSLFDLSYTCLLIPRLKSQTLDGDIAQFLTEALPELFLANGWRLEALDIGPSFLQWLVRIPPTIAPAEHINNIRMLSSRKILGNFSRLNRDELLKDFWAPGYLLGTGQSLFEAQDIIEFIRVNRRHYYPDDSVYSIPGSKFQVSHGKF